MFLLTAGPTNPSMYITLIRLSLYSAGLGPPGGVGDPRPGLNLSRLSDTLSVSLELPSPSACFLEVGQSREEGVGRHFRLRAFPSTGHTPLLCQ